MQVKALVLPAIACLLLCLAAAVRAEQSAAPATDDTVHFDIREYRISGNTLLDTRQIERAVYPFLGPRSSIADVEAAALALEKAYHDAGYQTVLVNIPEQDVRYGIVNLQVVQGSIDRVRISGSRYFSLGRIREKLPALQPGEVPNLPELQEQLTALNQATSDRVVTPVMRAGRTPGTLEVELMVKDELPLHGGLTLNNRDTQDTTALRATARLQYDNLWQKEHSLALLAQTSPEDTGEVKVFSGTYVMRLPDDRTYLALYGVKTESDVATADNLSVLGDGTILGARLIMPLEAVESHQRSITLGVDYKDFSNGASGNQVPISYINWSAKYSHTLLGENRRTGLAAGINFGLRGVGNDDAEFAAKRTGGKPSYAALQLEADHLMKLPSEYGLYARLAGQLASSPLVDNEQFGAGGVSTVRGYYESQQLGDHALLGRLELRTPPLRELFPEYVSNLHFLAFVDAAKLWVREAVGAADEFELAGAGVGLRFALLESLDGALDWAWALQSDGPVDKGDSRAHFSLEYGF
jgi:hemolysin activation/secretion protein